MTKRWVIPDIHGCFETLVTLIEKQIAPTKEETLFFLGDYIDRGKQSKQVLDYLMQFKEKGYAWHFIKGNHEDVLERCYATQSQNTSIGLYSLQDSWFHFGGKTTLESFQITDAANIPLFYIDFIAQMPYFIEQPDCILVHAGLNFLIENPFSDKLAMLWAKNYTVISEKISQKKLIHGHTPQTLESITQKINKQSNLLCLDNGCVFYKEKGLGNLLAFELNSQTLLIQPNIDKH